MGRSLILRAAALFFALWSIALLTTPAQAQLAPGCVCPAGFAPISPTACLSVAKKTAAPICAYRNLGQIAASQQQLSFWGIKTILQQKQDQLQSTPIPRGAGSTALGYVSTNSPAAANAVGDANRPNKNNPLALPLYDAAEAPAPADPVWGTWVQGLGDTERDSALSSADTTHSSNTYSAQAGLDRTQRNVLSADDALVLGIVSSWTSTRTGFENSSTKLDLVGPGVGLYSEYVRGGFSSDVTAKFDFLNLTEEFAGLAPNLSNKILNAGVSGNAQYKFMGTNNSFLEPTAGFSLTHTSFGSGADAIGLTDAYTLRLQTGARIGTTWDLGPETSLDANLKALVYGNAIAQGTSVAGTGPFVSVITPSDTGLVRGELDPELCFNLPRDYSLTFSGQYRFGRDLSGGSAAINLRKQW
jgi:Autotransporter beta-domain